MRRKIYHFLTIVLATIVLVGCAQTKEIVHSPYQDDTHMMTHPQTRAFDNGQYHAMMMYDKDQGMLGIMFMDKNEYPVNILRAKKVKAEMQFPGGESREFYFENKSSLSNFFSYYRGKGYRYRGSSNPPTDKIVVQYPWLKDIEKFTLKVWVPMTGATHVLEYEYPEK